MGCAAGPTLPFYSHATILTPGSHLACPTMEDCLMATKPPSTRRKLVRAAIQQLESLEAAGLTHLPNAKPGRIKPAAAGPAAARAAVAKPLSMTASAIGPTASSRRPARDSRPPCPLAANPRPTSSAAGEERVAAFAASRWRGCPLQAVRRVGVDPHANGFRRGLSPGAAGFSGRGARRRRRSDRPTVVGKAGQLLTKIIEACGLRLKRSTSSIP